MFTSCTNIATVRLHLYIHSHLAKVCAMAKDLCEECEDVIGRSNSQVRTCTVHVHVRTNTVETM